MDEWLSFEDVMIQLRVTSEGLKRMVSEGALQPYRGPDGAMRFKAEDVERLKSAGPPPSPPTDVLVIKPTDPIPPPSEAPRDRGAVSIAPTPVRPKPAKRKARRPAPEKKKKGAPRKKKR
jgi:hypothetical protein